MYKFKTTLSDEAMLLTHTEVKKTKEFKDYIKDPVYFKAPLMKKLDLSK